MINDITVLLNGDELKKFISVSVSSSLDAVASAFTFTIARDDFDEKIAIARAAREGTIALIETVLVQVEE